jgi:hypothetical protein
MKTKLRLIARTAELRAMRDHAIRLDHSISWVVQESWKRSRGALPEIDPRSIEMRAHCLAQQVPADFAEHRDELPVGFEWMTVVIDTAVASEISEASARLEGMTDFDLMRWAFRLSSSALDGAAPR